MTGEALKRNGRREQVVLATKVHGTMDDADPNWQCTSRRQITAECEAGLRRLQTDYIDLCQLHRPRPEIAIDETLRALDDLVRSGKVRYLGLSTFAAWQVAEGLWSAEELGLPTASSPSSHPTVSSIGGWSASSSRWAGRSASA